MDIIHEVQKYVNILGIPVMSYAIFLLYRTLVKRTGFLKDSLTDMKKIYDAVIETAQKRSTELEAAIEGQRRFNELYLKMVSDSNEHVEKIKEWRRSEINLLEDRLNALIVDLQKANMKIEELKLENKSLREQVNRMQTQVSSLNINIGPVEKGPAELQVRGGK